uniref:Putative secreted protein n=1 Tax=Ixodes ricinus TaxID=34613 RepID=A0A6B0U1J7_IXORI
MRKMCVSTWLGFSAGSESTTGPYSFCRSLNPELEMSSVCWVLPTAGAMRQQQRCKLMRKLLLVRLKSKRPTLR